MCFVIGVLNLLVYIHGAEHFRSAVASAVSYLCRMHKTPKRRFDRCYNFEQPLAHLAGIN